MANRTLDRVAYIVIVTTSGILPCDVGFTLPAANAQPGYIEVQKLLPSTLQIKSNYYSVAIDGDYAVVGAFGLVAQPGANPGAAFVYKFDYILKQWVLDTMLTASDAVPAPGAIKDNRGSRFGRQVAIQGNRIAVSAHIDNQNNNFENNSGAVYIFDRDFSGSWIQVSKLAISRFDSDERDNVTWADRLGYGGVAIDGPFIVAGAHLDDEAMMNIPGCEPANDKDGGCDPGAVWVFEVDALGNVLSRQKLLPWQDPQTLMSAQFGASIDISNGRIAVGSRFFGCSATDLGSSPNQPQCVAIRSGAVWTFVYDSVSGDWTPEQFFDPTLIPGITHHQWFGAYSVSLENNTLLVGTSLDEGAAHVFRRETGAWTLDAEILASDRNPQDRFGRWVDLDGEDTAYIGAFRRDGAAGVDTGAVYIYKRDLSGAWVETDIVQASDASADDELGVCLAAMNGRLLVGAPYDDSPGCGSNCTDHGSVYFFMPYDNDGDGVRDDIDNCPGVFNPTQEDFDFDGIGTC